MTNSIEIHDTLSIARGIPPSEEVGVGALTLGGYLREVAELNGPREAAIMWSGDSVQRWTYADLWQRSVEVARALVACGTGKGARIGILSTNRLE